MRHAPIARSEASVSICIGLVESNMRKVGASTYADLSRSNAFC